jgi:hypothetical protein
MIASVTCNLVDSSATIHHNVTFEAYRKNYLRFLEEDSVLIAATKQRKNPDSEYEPSLLVFVIVD